MKGMIFRHFTRRVWFAIASSLVLVLFFYVAFIQYQKFRWLARAYFINCSVFDSQMKVLKSVTGGMCQFLKTGAVVRYYDFDKEPGFGQEEISYIDENGQMKWSRKFLIHHTMKVSPDEQYVYFFSIEKKNIRERW